MNSTRGGQYRDHSVIPRGYTVDLLKKLLKVRGVEGAKLIEMYLEDGESHEDEALKALVKDAVGPYKEAVVFGGLPDSNAVSQSNYE